MYHAHVVLVHKPLKDLTSCASFYRPIALLYLDFKILTKLITLRLQPLLPTIIETNQTGSMANRSIDINLRRLHTNSHAQHLNQSSRVVELLDIEKAFDSVEWSFLWEVLRRMGFPLLFIQWLQTLYKRPTSAIKLGGGLSRPFPLSRRTRQGCPLSPDLISIAIEPVTEALRTSPHIKGLRIGWLEERVAMYADDLLLFLNDAGPSLEGALQVLNTVAPITGLKVNWPKSLLFPHQPSCSCGGLPDLPFVWVEQF